MALSQSNYTKQLSKSLLKGAAACTVRECDETAKGQYVAYVDDGDDSFDVSISLGKEGVVQEGRCDCGETEFCRHQAALLIHLAATTPKAGAKKAVAKSKRSVAAQLLDDLDPEILKAWVEQQLSVYKDLELAFLHRFAPASQQFTPKEAEALTLQAIKAVIGSRKKADGSEVKKITVLWKSLHAPIVDFYLANLTEAEAFDTFHALLESCITFPHRIAITSTRVGSYITELLGHTTGALATLATQTAFDKAIAPIIGHIAAPAAGIRMHYLLHLGEVAALCSGERKTALIEAIAHHYGASDQGRYHNGQQYTRFIFYLLDRNGLFGLHYELVKPIRYNNEFNSILIGRLVELGHLDLAERYCKEQIAVNFKEVYDLPYFLLLQQIYRQQGYWEGERQMAEKLLPHIFRYADYKLLYEAMPEGVEREKWRKRILAKAVSQYSNPAAAHFYFEVLHAEGDYNKMRDTLGTDTPYPTIVAFFDAFVATSPLRLLQVVLNRNDHWTVEEDEANETEIFEKLAALLLAHYPTATLLKAVADNHKAFHYGQSDRFVAFLKKELEAYQ
ncbi:hypothetical protein SAMN05444008_101412 [Cnuella takakiae]|uniref:SWIM-type domain-containing protein n=1 Tax=Cnuella takakiae TaxID=1302690 RepID=A0A1M4TI10_9BACT|nr:hypothetical protein [Cnuella takakiae]OLY90740.1 hypothetical protein BUE76_01620 [Cnuella takakiae]SHE43974.1 hypothetical protein SAMN05444008_101412 [Cnuella takakiae]